MATVKVTNKIAVISGLGNGVGTGASTANIFALQGYKIALVSRARKEIDTLKKEIEREGGEAEIFSLDVYDYLNINEVFRNIRKTWPQSRLSFACWNTGAWSMIPFMEIQERDIQNSVDINIVAATCFAQNAVEWFIEPTLLSRGENTTAPRGTLIFTGATSALRGSASFGAFAAGKHGLRALSQSIAREFGPQGVHVSFVVVDGTIRTKRTLALFGNVKDRSEGWLHDDMQTLSPDSIAKCYSYLHSQSPDAWTLEMDLRPAKEKF